MRFEILNVEHGFCAYAIAEDGDVLLFDCGHSSTIRPSEYLPARGIRSIRRLFITNYDEDHIGDLLNLRANLNIEVLTRNPSLSASQIRALKVPPISPAMTGLLEMINGYTGDVDIKQLEPPGIRVQTFHNVYPSFTDTNNLSLLTFLDVGPISFVLPGDLDRKGWLELLKNPQVRQCLSRVKVFVASHHGREDGYCEEVFQYCAPSLVVLSDGPIVHGTQEMAGTYARHASGAWFEATSGREWRKVITTRNDGSILWNLD